MGTDEIYEGRETGSGETAREPLTISMETLYQLAKDRCDELKKEHRILLPPSKYVYLMMRTHEALMGFHNAEGEQGSIVRGKVRARVKELLSNMSQANEINESWCDVLEGEIKKNVTLVQDLKSSPLGG